MKNEFFLGQGLGNDYIVLDPNNLTFPLTPGNIKKLCDRKTGVGSDGILTLEKSKKADFGLKIWNSDGSEAEISGNGLRIFAKYLHATTRTQKHFFSVETPGRCVQIAINFDAQGLAVGASVEMGCPTFKPSQLPCTLDIKELINQRIKVDEDELIFTGVSVGNPHCVIFNPRGYSWNRNDLLKLGPKLEHHPIFPDRINVQLAEQCDVQVIRILIWERGVGETQSSGSSACAVASAAFRLGLVDAPVTIQSPGGCMKVERDRDFNLTLSGPVSEVKRGVLSSRLLRDL